MARIKATVFLSAALAVPALFAAMNASAHPHKSNGPNAFYERLDLTDEQRDAMTALREKYPRGRGGMIENRQEVRELMQAGQVDEAAELAGEYAAQRVRNRAAVRAEMKDILSEEQLEQMLQFRERGGWHGRRFRRDDTQD